MGGSSGDLGVSAAGCGELLCPPGARATVARPVGWPAHSPALRASSVASVMGNSSSTAPTGCGTIASSSCCVHGGCEGRHAIGRK